MKLADSFKILFNFFFFTKYKFFLIIIWWDPHHLMDAYLYHTYFILFIAFLKVLNTLYFHRKIV